MTKNFKSHMNFKGLILFIFMLIPHLYSNETLYFDPQLAAKEETAAWKAYYHNDFKGLMQHLSQLVIIEFRLNPITAWTTVIPQLMTAAMVFKNLPDETSTVVYENKVFPHLLSAYQEIQRSLKGSFDPALAAHLELDWWIYRRNEKTSNPELVGKKIAQLYELIYGTHDDNHFDRAAYLRAMAGRYRDLSKNVWQEVDAVDWFNIESILGLAYKEFVMGIEANLSHNLHRSTSSR